MKAIQVPMSSGGVVLIAVSEEVESDSEQTMGGTIARGKTPAETVHDLGDVGGAIAEVCKSVRQKVLDGIGDAKPNELALTFGLKLSGTAAIPLVTSTTIEGTFQVTAKWDFTEK